MSLPSAIAAARDAVTAARVAPQSRKKAMLAALLLDAAVDALFVGRAEQDILELRSALTRKAPALAPVFDLVAMDARAELVLEPVEISLDDYPALGVEDYMVSLYNNRTVPRVLIAWPDGRRTDIHQALAAALTALEVEVRS